MGKAHRPRLYTLQANNKGEIRENTEYGTLGRSGKDIRPPEDREVSPAPYGATLYFLPGRIPLGWSCSHARIEPVTLPGKGKRSSLTAAALVPPPGYTRTLLPAYRKRTDEPLPFYAYSMGAYCDEVLYIAAVATDISLRWDPSQYHSLDLDIKIKKKLKAHGSNRLLRHLAHCAREYGCYNAQNIFYQRWEGGIPVSRSCNASCLGCISKSRDEGPSSPQERISFIPTPEEVVEIAAPHLESGSAIVSFGQGCEGEPTVQEELLFQAISATRARTSKGTININTNGSRPAAIRRLITAGLNGIRVSLNSAIEERYNIFFRPSGYTFSDVMETLKSAKGDGIFVSLNLFTFPGVTDSEEELSALHRLIETYSPDMIQLRNLNIDPDLYFESMPEPAGNKLGIVTMIDSLRSEFPSLRIGSFTPALFE